MRSRFEDCGSAPLLLRFVEDSTILWKLGVEASSLSQTSQFARKPYESDIGKKDAPNRSCRAWFKELVRIVGHRRHLQITTELLLP